MDKKITSLYNDIKSENFAEATTTLGELLETKIAQRLKTVLTTEENV